MSTRKSILILANTGNTLNEVGEAIKADSYYGYTDGMSTVQVTYQNFTGGFGMQGTLSLEPKEEDWFWIRLNELPGTPYITYPKDPMAPTGSTSSSFAGSVGDAGSDAFTFIGNYTFLRAILTRDYIEPPPSEDIDGRFFLGQIDRVLLSL